MAKISLARALIELKHLGDKINRANANNFIGVTKGQDKFLTVVGVPAETKGTAATMLSVNLQSAYDLISRFSSLKEKVIQANVTTTVTIAGRTMTIAGAVAHKNSVIPLQRNLLQSLRSQLLTASNTVTTSNNKLDAEIEAAIRNLAGNEKAMKGFSETEYEEQARPRKLRGEFALLNPNDLQKVIDNMSNEIEAFMADVDVALSEANAKTEIEV